MFGMIISKVLLAWSPEDSKLSLFDYVTYSIEMHVHGLWFISEKIFFAMNTAVELSTWIAVGPCLHPISVRVVWIGTSVWALTKMVPYSSSAADAMTLSMILHKTSNMPLTVGTKSSVSLGLGGPSLRKCTSLVRLLSWETERYDALECMANCTALALYWIYACGLEAR